MASSQPEPSTSSRELKKKKILTLQLTDRLAAAVSCPCSSCHVCCLSPSPSHHISVSTVSNQYRFLIKISSFYRLSVSHQNFTTPPLPQPVANGAAPPTANARQHNSTHIVNCCCSADQFTKDPMIIIQ